MAQIVNAEVFDAGAIAGSPKGFASAAQSVQNLQPSK
jgi:hypothetical protein